MESTNTVKSKNPITRFIDFLFSLEEKRGLVTVNRKKYLLVALFLGWCGGHRFLSKRYVLGVLYAAFFWTGISMAMTIIDIMIALPKPVDENGNIQI